MRYITCSQNARQIPSLTLRRADLHPQRNSGRCTTILECKICCIRSNTTIISSFVIESAMVVRHKATSGASSRSARVHSLHTGSSRIDVSHPAPPADTLRIAVVVPPSGMCSCRRSCSFPDPHLRCRIGCEGDAVYKRFPEQRTLSGGQR